MAKAPLSKEATERVRKALKEMVGNERTGMFPPHLDIIRKAARMEFNEADEETYADLLESICGLVDDSQPVEQYDGTLGVTTAFVAAHQAPVGQLQWNNNLASIYTNPGNVSGIRWCTGTMITRDLFLTAGHCFDQTGGGWVRPLDNMTGTTISPAEIATNMHVNFNYQVDPAGVLRIEQSYPILSLVEYRLGSLDFAIVRLGGDPGNVWGTTQVSTTDAASGDMLCIIGHPAGWPKRIEAGPCLNVVGSTIQYDDIDTLGGNSGSGVLRASDGRIVGVHTNGGCGPSSPGIGFNFGVRITSIIAVSPTLQNVTSPTFKLKVVDDNITLKFNDDVNTLKFVDDPSRKVLDDNITFKFADDSVTSPALDAVNTSKAFDDQKSPALDKGFSDQKLPGNDWMPWQGGHLNFGQGGPAPFVLTNPHHSMAWSGPGMGTQGSASQSAQYEQALQQMEAQMRQYMEALNQLDAAYRQLLSEYEAYNQRKQA